MSFLSVSPVVAGLLLAGTAATVAVLYWLKPPPRRIVVPSKLLWDRLLREKRRSTFLDRLRWWISLMIALIIGLSVAAALGRPEFTWAGGEIPRMTIVIDNSATMATATSDGFTRWDHAVAIAKDLMRQGSVDGEFLILDTTGQAPALGPDDRRSALEILDGLGVSMGDSPQFPTALGPDGPLYFISDGVMVDDVPPEAEVISVYDPVDNVGITAFEVTSVPSAPLQYQAFLEVTNASLGPKEISLRVGGAGAGGLRDTMTLQSGEATQRTIELAGFDRGPVRAAVTSEGDAFAVDDVAFSFVPVRSLTRVALVTPGSVYLESVLAEEPHLRVSSLTPAAYDTAAVRADLFIFDRWAPEQPPPGPSLLFFPPNVDWLAPAVAVINSPTVSGWDSEHALMRFVSLEDLRVDRAVQLGSPARRPVEESGGADPDLSHPPDADVHVVVGSAELPLIVASDAPPKVIRAAFALEDSNFALQPAFPIFLSNVLRWTMDEQAALPRRPGRVEVSLPGGEVTDLEGQIVNTAQVSGRTVFAADEPGLYTVAAGSARLRVAVSLLDRERTSVNASGLSPRDRAVASPAALGTVGDPAEEGELWTILLVVAMALVILEWFTYHRRWTV